MRDRVRPFGTAQGSEAAPRAFMSCGAPFPSYVDRKDIKKEKDRGRQGNCCPRRYSKATASSNTKSAPDKTRFRENLLASAGKVRPLLRHRFRLRRNHAGDHILAFPQLHRLPNPPLCGKSVTEVTLALVRSMLASICSCGISNFRILASQDAENSHFSYRWSARETGAAESGC